MSKTGLPYSENCYICGKNNPYGLKMRFYMNNDTVHGEFIPQKEHQGYNDIVHGGILCSILDEALGWAPTILTKRMTLSAELTIRFIRPAPIGKKLIVSTKAGEIHRKLYSASGQITDEKGTVYVTGSGKFIPISEEKTREINSWLIYDENTARVMDDES